MLQQAVKRRKLMYALHCTQSKCTVRKEQKFHYQTDQKRKSITCTQKLNKFRNEIHYRCILATTENLTF